MKIILENTDQFTTVAASSDEKGVPARVWIGQTDSGTPVRCYITRISPQTHDPHALELFQRELTETPIPRAAIGAIPLRLIL